MNNSEHAKSKYVESWMKHIESGESRFRDAYLRPFLEEALSEYGEGSRILDVGCAWGEALRCMDEKVDYIGVDPYTGFFSRLKERFPKRKIITLEEGSLPGETPVKAGTVTLAEGSLPGDIPVKDGICDAVVCSMALHNTRDLEGSMNMLFRKSKGGVIIVEFSNQAVGTLVDRNFVPGYIEKFDDRYIKGRFRFGSGIEIEGFEVYFHTEEEIEYELRKHCDFDEEKDKVELRELAVGYKCKKR